MNLFIDCEWNDWGGELISMALVPEDGYVFYESLGCENPSPWVAEHVVPVINKEPISADAFQSKLNNYLSEFDSVHVIADWPEDIAWFCRMLITGPGQRLNTPHLTFEIMRDLDTIQSIMPHNALADALANAGSYRVNKLNKTA